MLHATGRVGTGIGCRPGAINARVARAIGRRGRVSERDDHSSTAVIGGGGYACVVSRSRATTLQILVWRTRDDRRGRIDKTDVLHATGCVGAGIGCRPGAINARVARAIRRRGRVAERDDDSSAAIIGGGGYARIVGRSRVTTLQILVRRTRDDRRGRIDKPDMLHATGRVRAGIGCRPGAIDAGVARAVCWRGRVSEADDNSQ